MPCTVERHPIGRNDHMQWFCCNCRLGGPLNITINLHCPHCYHQRCSVLQYNDFGENAGSTESGDAHALVPLVSPFRPQLESTARVLDRNLGAGHDDSIATALVAEQDFEHEMTDSSLNLRIFSQQSTPHASRFLRPSDLQAIPEVELPWYGRNSRKLSMSPSGGSHTCKRKRSSAAANGQSHLTQDGRNLSGTPAAGIDSDTDQANERVFACPFLVMNVHRYVHFKNQSCYKAWTLPRLREHIIGRSQPKGSRHGVHTFHECDDCFGVFSNEHELITHKHGHQCQRASSYPLPAEGVGKFLSEKISELTKGPKGDRRSEEDERAWSEWYRVLNGTDPPAQSCYFSVAIALCNDPGALKDSKEQLLRTFQRALPIEQKAEALQCYLKSQQSAVLASLESSINQDELKRARVILEHTATKSDRRKKRPSDPERGKAELVDHSEEPNDSANQKTVLWKPSGPTDPQSTVSNMDDGSQYTSLYSPGGLAMIYEHPANHSSAPNMPWATGHRFSVTTPHTATLRDSMQCKDTPFATRDDALDTLYEIKPQLVLNEPQILSATERIMSSEKFHTTEPLGKSKIRTEIQQPSHSHGTFKEDMWDPQSAPLFATNPPPSDGLYPYDGLFNVADIGYTSWGTSYYTDET